MTAEREWTSPETTLEWKGREWIWAAMMMKLQRYTFGRLQGFTIVFREFALLLALVAGG